MMISLPKPANASLRRQDAWDHQPKQDKDSHNVHGQRLPGKEHHGNKEERQNKGDFHRAVPSYYKLPSEFHSKVAGFLRNEAMGRLKHRPTVLHFATLPRPHVFCIAY